MNIGANGSLEIALLTDDTFEDPERIRTNVGDSADIRPAEEANITWGNLIDLSSVSYGLDRIKLYPSMLYVSDDSDQGIRIGEGLLQTPSFGNDGRVIAADMAAVNGTMADGTFVCDTRRQSHGVRGIGYTDGLSAQQIAMMRARSAMTVYSTLARQAAVSALQQHGQVVFNMPVRSSSDAEAVYTDADVRQLRELALGALTSLDHVDTAIRHSLVALASTQILDPGQFEFLYSTIMNKHLSLNTIMRTMPVTMPSFATDLAGDYVQAEADMRAVIAACNALSGGRYTWSEVRPITEYIVNMGKVYLEGDLFDPAAAVSNGAQMVLLPESGVFSAIAGFIGSYTSYISGLENAPDYYEVTVDVRTDQTTPRISLMAGLSAQLLPVGAGDTRMDINDLYGYAVDLAFRTNAPQADLLLQTYGEQRIYDDATDPDTEGQGSFMTFYSSQLDEERMVQLMDAVRVSFIDGSGKLLGMAKLNTSNYSVYDEGVRAPLYLYEYSCVSNVIVMGERRGESGAIVSLPRNIPTIVSAVVWLDGNAADNTIASAFGASVTGTLNLQFTCSTELVPAEYGSLHDTTDYLVEQGGHILARGELGNIVPSAEDITSITLYGNLKSALRDYGTLPEYYYVLIRDGKAWARAYIPDDTAAPSEDGEYDIILVGYDVDRIVAPTDCSGLFGGLTHLRVINNLDLLDVSNVQDMSGMFRDCKFLTQLDVSGWDVNDACVVSNMFTGCSSLADLELNGWSEQQIAAAWGN